MAMQPSRPKHLRATPSSCAMRWVRAPIFTPSIDQQISQLDQQLAVLSSAHQDAVQRLAQVPGQGADSAQQIITC
jgi:hypothetical protein